MEGFRLPSRSHSFHQVKADILIGIMSVMLYIILGFAFFFCLSLNNIFLRYINRTLATTLLTFAAMAIAMHAVYGGFDVGRKKSKPVISAMISGIAITDLVISRAGANAICELLALRIPNILVPLPLEISRGDQLLNAQSFEDQGYSVVIKEESLDEDSLVEGVQQLYFNRDRYIETMSRSHQYNSVDTIINLIEEICDEKG